MPALHEEIFVLFIIIRYTIKRFDAFKGKIIQKDEGTDWKVIPCRRLWKLHCCRLEMLLFMTESSYGVCLGKNMSGQSKQVYLETKVQLTLPAN